MKAKSVELYRDAFFAEGSTIIVTPVFKEVKGTFQNESDNNTYNRGTVVSKGAASEMEAIVGDDVLFGEFSGQEFEYLHQGDDKPKTYKILGKGEARVTIPKKSL